jgi:16S rRNA (uracil1498-N3)-methyltransferase
MTERYYSETPIVGDRAALSGPEAHHLRDVMRARVGDELVLFDGTGAEFTARVEQMSKHEARLAVLARTIVDREAPRDVTLCCALPRGDRQRWLIEKAVELGVRRFVPLKTARGVVQPDAGVCERLRRTVVEASKQCGRNVLMEIAEPCGVPPAANAFPTDAERWVAHPSAEVTLADAVAADRLPTGKSVAILIGPEGGFTDAEIDAALAAGWRAVALGSRILRIETAALMAAALATMR